MIRTFIILTLICQILTIKAQVPSLYLFVRGQVESNNHVSVGVIIDSMSILESSKQHIANKLNFKSVTITEMEEELWACCTKDTIKSFGIEQYVKLAESNNAAYADSIMIIYKNKLKAIQKRQKQIKKSLKQAEVGFIDNPKVYVCKVKLNICSCKGYYSLDGNWQYIQQFYIENILDVQKLTKKELKFIKDNSAKIALIFK